ERVELAVVTANAAFIHDDVEGGLEERGRSLGSGGGSAIASTDWNMDGAADLIIVGTQSARLYLNDGTGNFAAAHSISVAGAAAVAAAELNGDGMEELAFPTATGLVLVGNDGNGTPSARRLSSTPALHVAHADLDQNGHRDLIVTGNGSVVMMLNSGGAFQARGLPSGQAAGVTAIDIDGDGDADLVYAVSAFSGGPPINTVLRNDGGASFTTGSGIGASPTLQLLSGDMDGDGALDLVSINATGVHQVYLSDPQGGFRLHARQVLAGGATGGVLGDVTGDGALDLLIMREAAGEVAVYFDVGRTVVEDVTAPTISLVGESLITLAVNQPYEELGAVAADDVDGDLSDRIEIDNPVDTSLIGTYQVIYRVTDSDGNTAEAVRTVIVQPTAESGGGGGGSFGGVGLF